MERFDFGLLILHVKVEGEGEEEGEGERERDDERVLKAKTNRKFRWSVKHAGGGTGIQEITGC